MAFQKVINLILSYEINLAFKLFLSSSLRRITNSKTISVATAVISVIIAKANSNRPYPNSTKNISSIVKFDFIFAIPNLSRKYINHHSCSGFSSGIFNATNTVSHWSKMTASCWDTETVVTVSALPLAFAESLIVLHSFFEFLNHFFFSLLMLTCDHLFLKCSPSFFYHRLGLCYMQDPLLTNYDILL